MLCLYQGPKEIIRVSSIISISTYFHISNASIFHPIQTWQRTTLQLFHDVIREHIFMLIHHISMISPSLASRPTFSMEMILMSHIFTRVLKYESLRIPQVYFHLSPWIWPLWFISVTFHGKRIIWWKNLRKSIYIFHEVH